mmetsp:Transcript_21810/g.19343  ORF Transcript_21810/g.19343 Transcript_21810/m.19343 type:complete len:262 (+) Transcript_21810:204-989(+)
MTKEDLAVAITIEEPVTFKFIPISSSENFKKDDLVQTRNSYFDLLNLETEVLYSNRPELIGQHKTILNHQQLASLGCLVNSQSKERVEGNQNFVKNLDFNEINPQLNSVVNPNMFGEGDLFWDNFYIFKQREEEKKQLLEDDHEDSDHEDLPQRPIKIGSILKNPHILVKIMMRKNLKKLGRRLMFVNSVGGMSIMILLFLLQLKYSKSFRRYFKTVAHLALFVFTFIGMGGSAFLIYTSIRGRKRKPKDETIKDSDSKKK